MTKEATVKVIWHHGPRNAGNLKSRKWQRMGSPQKSPEGTSPTKTLTFALENTFQTPVHQNYTISVLFQATRLVVICYSRNRKLIQCRYGENLNSRRPVTILLVLQKDQIVRVFSHTEDSLKRSGT